MIKKPICLSTLSTDAASQLDVLRHDGDTLSVNSTQVSVFEQAYKVSLGRFLKSQHSGGLEAQVVMIVCWQFWN
jgi:hypothetical protein